MHLKKIIIYTVLILIIIAGSNCKKQEEKSGTINVAVSIFPLYDIVRNVAGNKARVFYAIPAGADPHTFEPRPSTAAEIRKADLFIGVSKEFDGWIEHYLPDSAARQYLIARPKGTGTPGNTGHEEQNPHIWLSVRKAKTIARDAARALKQFDSKNSGYYDLNLAAYNKKLNEADGAMARLFQNKKNRSFIQWHESWNYFAADYGLTITGTVQREGSDKASVRSIKEIVDRARRGKVKVIAVSLDAEVKAARVLASEIAGTVVILDGIGTPAEGGRSDYLKLMQYNAKALADALR